MIKYTPLLILLCLLTACETHETYLKMHLEKDFSAYNNIGILPVRNTMKTEIQIYPDMLAEMIASELQELELFESVIALDEDASQQDMEGLDLLIKHKIIMHDQPLAVATIFAKDEAFAEIDVEFTFVDMKTKETVGNIGITSDSKNMGTWSAAGLGITGAASYSKKAFKNNAEGLRDYVVENHKDAVKKE